MNTKVHKKYHIYTYGYPHFPFNIQTYFDKGSQKKMFKYKKIVTSFGIFDQLRVSKSDNNHRNRSSQNKTIHNRKNNTKIKANCIQVKIKISYICM